VERVRAGNAPEVRGFHIRTPSEPHHERRSGSGPVHEGGGRDSAREAGAHGPTGVAQRASESAGPTASDMQPPRVRRRSRHERHDHPLGRHGPPLLLLRPQRTLGHPAPPRPSPEPVLQLRCPDRVPLAVPHPGPATRQRRGGPHYLHRERAVQVQPSSSRRLLRKRFCVFRGGYDCGEVMRESVGVCFGIGEEGEGGSERGVHAVVGRSDGYSRTASLHGGSVVSGVRCETCGVRRG